jgi:hypothetical protein
VRTFARFARNPHLPLEAAALLATVAGIAAGFLQAAL